MTSKVIEMLDSFYENQFKKGFRQPEASEINNFLYLVRSSESERIALQERYLPRKLMRLSSSSYDRAGEAMERSGLRFNHNLDPASPKPWPLWIIVHVNAIDIGVLADASISLLAMPPEHEFIKTSGEPFHVPNADDRVLYATELQQLGDKASNCEECSGDGSGEALPPLEQQDKFATDELCPHNLQPEDCMFCKVI